MPINTYVLGRLTSTPELRTTPNGVSCSTVTVASDRRYAGADGQRATDFLEVVCWRGMAEFVTKYFKKGDPIFVQGDLTFRKYTDKNGVKRTAAELIADRIEFVPAPPKAKEAEPATDPDVDDLPLDYLSGFDIVEN